MAKKLMSDLQRVMSKVEVDPNTGCWVWRGWLDRDGYAGLFRVGSRTDGSRRQVRVHRFMYEISVGAIPEGYVIDHLCRNRACQNPGHMEAVTPLVNHSRGLRAKHEICPQGHSISGENDVGYGTRCRICRNAYRRAYNARTGNGRKHVKAYRERRKEKQNRNG